MRVGKWVNKGWGGKSNSGVVLRGSELLQSGAYKPRAAFTSNDFLCWRLRFQKSKALKGVDFFESLREIACKENI